MDSKRIQDIQKNTGFPESKSVSAALLQVWNEVANEYKEKEKWKHISTAPIDGTIIQLLMDSGYRSTPYSVLLARYIQGYSVDGLHDFRWRTIGNDSVYDYYNKIIAWKNWEVPEIDFEKDSHIILTMNEQIFPGDEILINGEWKTITEEAILTVYEATGKTFIKNRKGAKIRRKISE